MIDGHIMNEVVYGSALWETNWELTLIMLKRLRSSGDREPPSTDQEQCSINQYYYEKGC